MGFKTFANNELLTAADLNNYIMRQAVIVVANVTARNAIPTPNDGMVVYLEDVDVLQVRVSGAWVAILTATPLPYVEFRLNAGQSLATGTGTTLDLDASPTVIKGTWAEAAGVITIPEDGYYDVEFWGAWAANATGIRDVQITRGGTTDVFAQETLSAAVSIVNHVHRVGYLTAGSNLRVRAAQNSGGSLSIGELGTTKTPLLTIRKVGAR